MICLFFVSLSFLEVVPNGTTQGWVYPNVNTTCDKLIKGLWQKKIKKDLTYLLT
jgi:hypothetical protein